MKMEEGLGIEEFKFVYSHGILVLKGDKHSTFHIEESPIGCTYLFPGIELIRISSDFPLELNVARRKGEKHSRPVLNNLRPYGSPERGYGIFYNENWERHFFSLIPDAHFRHQLPNFEDLKVIVNGFRKENSPLTEDVHMVYVKNSPRIFSRDEVNLVAHIEEPYVSALFHDWLYSSSFLAWPPNQEMDYIGHFKASDEEMVDITKIASNKILH